MRLLRRPRPRRPRAPQPGPVDQAARLSETPVTFAGAGRASTETVIASARSCWCLCGIETAIAFAGAKWAFWFSFRVQWCCWFQRRHAVAPCALSFWGARVRVVTNVVNPMAFSLKMAVFGLRLTTFVTGVLARRFESRWFDDVCNVGRPLVARPRPPAYLKPSSPLRVLAGPRLKLPSPLRVRNGCFWCSFRAQR